MPELEQCSFCGVKNKFLYICPHCGLKFCSKHKKPQDHNCELNEVIDENAVENDAPFEPIVNTDNLIDSSIENSNFENEEYNEDISVDSKDEEFDSENVNFEELNTGIILDSFELEKENDILDDDKLLFYDNLFDEDYMKELDSDILSRNINYESNDEVVSSGNAFKLLGIVLLVIVVVTSISIFGHLYITDNIKKSYLDQTSTLEQDNMILTSKYNDLYLDYIELEEKFNSLNSDYNELEESNQEQVNYSGEIILENMRQLTIDEESNIILFYEIPNPGYITIECYSDEDISILVGSSIFEEVYYARYPLKNTATDIKFEIPVVPDVNLVISNSNKSQKATIFLWIKYNYLE